jgi:hypothetical protein
MSFDDEIDALAPEYYPGSSRKIENTPDQAAQRDSWDLKPRVYKVNGEDVQFFTVGHLAVAMNRKPLTIRQWERKGIIPKSTYQRQGREGSQHGRRRLYTRAQIEGMIRIAHDEGLLSNDRREIAKTQFTVRVIELFKRLAAER